METIGKNTETEKRKSPRNYYNVPFHYETEGMNYIGFMSNVSVGGAFFNTSASLNIGQKISFNVVLPERGFSILNGNVLRSEPSGYGINFQERI